jgi:hypothetical protein
MAEDREQALEKGVSTRCGYASPLAWPHDEAGTIRLSPQGLVADILANGAMTLTNDIGADNELYQRCRRILRGCPLRLYK